ncbi:TauD/TfdA family dioxygenase [Chitinophaga pendula]|uniref:TauD/TfdA dioxygenase family protein n=1 Tax=Chitinophaga TaxID=79328 RepID=UPI000BB062DE|nr:MULTISPECIES: TauD/TfdA family dioxygenase [Chitinophaga]ASZ13273.1 pyoverdine biosynthesis protein PvcB [Chitinophaga sp. MD30]UCJ09103.1 TauD/TfdA family dioxygenase [Chitinophaga pendula]
MKYTVTALQPFGFLIEAYSNDDNVEDISTGLLKDCFERGQLIVLRGFKAFNTTDDFADYCERWGEISLWPFGKVLELKKQPNPEDHIFDNNYVPLHWDGMYRPEVPEYQIFRCVDSPDIDQGGRTTFSNTAILLEKATEEQVKLWENIQVRYTRKMEFYESTTLSPIVTKHPYKDRLVMRYNEPPERDIPDFINPPVIDFLGVSENALEEIQSELKAALYDPAVYYAHTWQKGDVVIADNFTLLHGREAYAADAYRHLQRVHVNSSPAFKNPGLEAYK